MEKTLVSFDWAIKGVLRDKANFDVLSGFLSELLKQDIEVVEILESESNKRSQLDKSNRLDLKAKINGGEIAIFEIQSNTEGDFFHRILYGTSKAVVEQLSKGNKYGKIKKVYSIDVVYFELGQGNDYIYHGLTEFRGLHNKKEKLLLSSDEMKFLPQYKQLLPDVSAGELFPEYYIIYPNKFDEKIRGKFDEWVYFLKHSKVKSSFSAKGIRKAGEALAYEKMSQAEKNDYEVFIKAERVKASQIDTALWKGERKGMAKGLAKGLKKGLAEGEKKGRAKGLTEGLAEGKKVGLAEGEKKGRAKGLAEGEKKGKIETARKMKAKGADLHFIAEVTGLTANEIKTLRNSKP